MQERELFGPEALDVATISQPAEVASYVVRSVLRRGMAQKLSAAEGGGVPVLEAAVELVTHFVVGALEQQDSTAAADAPTPRSAHLGELRKCLLEARSSDFGETLLFLAAGTGRELLVAALVAAGGGEYALAKTHHGDTALHAAVAAHDLATSMLLLNSTKLTLSGEHMKNNEGVPPLECGRPAFRQALLARQAEGSFAAFISHYKTESAAEATYIKEWLSEHLARDVFLDSDNLREITAEAMSENIRRSDVVIILQTPNYLTRPYCLIEILVAIDMKKPLLPLKVENGYGSYDFADASALLADLETELPRRGCQYTLDELRKNRVDVAEASRKLSATIPQTMSMPYCQACGEYLRHGALWDLLSKVEAADYAKASDKSSPPVSAMTSKSSRGWLARENGKSAKGAWQEFQGQEPN